MSISVKRKIETAEPVQLSIDFLDNMLAMRKDEETTEDYWCKLLREKRREIMEDYYTLAPLLSTIHHGLCYSDGMEAGRMLVMRILLSILPYSYPSGFSLVGTNQNIQETIREVIKYLKSLYLANEGDHLSWKNAVLLTTRIMLNKGFSPYFLRRGGWPVLVVAPPYREITAACYLAEPHTITLYSNGDLSPERRCYYFLHELGHLIFHKCFARPRLTGHFKKLVAQLKPSTFGQFLDPGSQGTKEIFSNLFAFALLMDTQPGTQLFGTYYQKTGNKAHLLRNFFSPSSLFRHS